VLWGEYGCPEHNAVSLESLDQNQGG